MLVKFWKRNGGWWVVGGDGWEIVKMDKMDFFRIWGEGRAETERSFRESAKERKSVVVGFFDGGAKCTNRRAKEFNESVYQESKRNPRKRRKERRNQRQSLTEK